MGEGRPVRFVWIMIIGLFLALAAFLIFTKGNPVDTLLPPLDDKTNFVIFGLDESGRRTDSIITGCLNVKEECINLLSIPRDTLVTVPADRLAVMKRLNSSLPGSDQMKINAIYAYGGEEYGANFTVKQIEELLGVNIQYYITIDLKAFRDIVDKIGGVEYNVPFRMKYTDPSQGLDIDLQPGPQLLDGIQAEELVRYRKSDDGSHPEYTDINRTRTQQEFTKAVIEKMVSTDNLVEDASILIPALQQYTQSNIDAATAAKYIRHIRQLKNFTVVPHTLVCQSEDIKGISYVIVNTEVSKDIISSAFGLNGSEGIKSSKGIPVLLLNGGAVSGIAARARDYLTSKGFTVSGVGDYQGKRVAYTRIYVKKEGMGQDIQALYPNSKIVVDASAFNEEIVVVLGLEVK